MAEDPDRLARDRRAATRPSPTRSAPSPAPASPRADIARFLGKRYQHVRNVLEGDAQSRPEGGGYVLGKADLSGVRRGPRPFERDDDATLTSSDAARPPSGWR